MNELVKTQMMMSMGVAKNPLTNILAINMFDIAVKTFPAWSMWARSTLCCARKRHPNAIISSLVKNPRASITCERGATQQANKVQSHTLYQARMDAVIHCATSRPEMKSLLSVTHHDYLPNEFEPISLESDTFFELIDLQVTDGAPSIVKFKLFCYEHDIQHLQTFVENCAAEYERHMLNKLGSHCYFFDQVVQTKVKGTTQNPLPTTHLLYTKSKFTTNRTFDNVFFDDRVNVQKRTNFFLEQKSWYDKKGIPYTLGFMFHGPPGCGKTSTVKAIANEGGRHIINIQLSEIKTKSQLRHLFFNDEIHVYNGATTEKYTIPVADRLYVIEDIDAMGDTVLRREWKKPEQVKTKKTDEDAWLDREKESDREVLDLSFILNLLDGTLEANGRILIITTNFPSRIDQALIRPGRIDMIVNFKKCSVPIMQEMVNSFYDRTDLIVPNLPELHEKWSPAEVNQILFRNLDTPEKSIAEFSETFAKEFTEPHTFLPEQ